MTKSQKIMTEILKIVLTNSRYYCILEIYYDRHNITIKKETLTSFVESLG